MNHVLWWLILGGLAFLFLRSRGASKASLKALVARGAQRVDVRSASEFSGGHAPETLNIPLDQLTARLQELEVGRPVIVCCASGARSGMAASLLKKHGFEAVNAGGWHRLRDLS